MGDCGSSPAGKGRPALPDQPEEREEDPLPMPNRIWSKIILHRSLKN